MKREHKSLLDKLDSMKAPTEAEKKLSLKRKRIISLCSVVITLALFIWLGYYVTDVLMFSCSSEGGIKAAAGNFKTLIESYGNAGVFVAFAIQVLQVVVSPIPGEVVEVGMGLCFGWFWGMVICLLGGALGAWIIMIFVRKFGFKVVELFVPLEKINELRFINNEKKLERTVFLLYIFPGTPKDPLIFFFGLTKIKIRDFIIISTIARIPSIVSSTIGGEFLVAENYLGAVLIFAITGAVSIVGLIAYRAILKKLKKKHNKHRLVEDGEQNEDK